VQLAVVGVGLVFSEQERQTMASLSQEGKGKVVGLIK
jgi:hypothetical protein